MLINIWGEFMNKKYFILHGHFYQPPRENPWTGFVDRQPSAFPYNDWNTRINLECYSACTRTSVLDHQEVLMTINCYEYLSFNFGPTLLSWMQQKDADPDTLKKIIEADKISVLRNNGHGNAIAQVYNHMIMPLANIRDQYTQILWGLQDFKMRFGRDSEGIWLGETAINNETAAILVDCGMKFVILSPYQAEAINTGMNRIDVLGGKVDPGKPYVLKTKNGDLAVFFYHGGLAAGISFGNLLLDAQNLHNAIDQAFEEQSGDVKLVHTATDGEVYGHHKAYGNMALAKVIYDIIKNKGSEFQFTNYGRFLEEYPPTEECILHLGDDGLGSSWSCVHGVGRWMRDCGCHTGGAESWDQKWRGPLREAFNYLREEIQDTIEELTKDKLIDVWKARNDFFTPFSTDQDEDYQAFFEKHQKKELTKKEKIQIITMMKSLDFAMLMYTSCGWFFSDISGIETIQDILYAERAYETMKEFLGIEVYPKFLSLIEKGVSNVNVNMNGKSILDNSILTSKLSLNTLKEYICWIIYREGDLNITHVTNEFSFEIMWADEKQERFVAHFKNHIGLDIYTKFYLIEEKGHKSRGYYLVFKDEENYSDIECQKEEFWKQDESWVISYLVNLPLSLRICFLAQGVRHEMIRKNRRSERKTVLTLDAAWGAESLLLPYEKRILVFYYASQIFKFAQTLAYEEPFDHNIETFLKEAELLKKSAESLDEAKLYLEPMVIALNIYLKQALTTENINILKNSRVIFWVIKDCISASYTDILRNQMYEFYKGHLHIIKNTAFISEFKSLMKEAGFSKSILY